MLLGIKKRYEQEAIYLERVINFLSSPEKDKIHSLDISIDSLRILSAIFDFKDRVVLTGRIEDISNGYFYLPYNKTVYLLFYHITSNNVIIYSHIYALGFYDLCGTLDPKWSENILHIHSKYINKALIDEINNQLSYFMTCQAGGKYGGLNIKQHEENKKKLTCLINQHNSIIKEKLYRIKYGE